MKQQDQRDGLVVATGSAPPSPPKLSLGYAPRIVGERVHNIDGRLGTITKVERHWVVVRWDDDPTTTRCYHRATVENRMWTVRS